MFGTAALTHPNLAKHPSIRARDLVVVGVYSNPRQYIARERNFVQWIDRMIAAGVTLVVGEHAFGERDFVLDAPALEARGAQVVQIRGGASQELWLKEAIGRLVVGRIADHRWKYLLWCDTDVIFVDPDFAEKTIHMLQHNRVGQPWTHAADLGHDGSILANEWGNAVDRSFSAAWRDGEVFAPDNAYGNSDEFRNARKLFEKKYDGEVKRDYRQHYGYVWAYQRAAYDGMGGFPEWLITGSGDYHMAMGFAGLLHLLTDSRKSAGYNRRLTDMAAKYDRAIQQDIGVLPGTILHMPHGKKKDRQYLTRDDILIASKFDPDVDLALDWQGIPYICTDNRILRDGSRRYNCQRHEDSIDA